MGAIPCPFAYACSTTDKYLFVAFFAENMVKRQEKISILLLCAVVIIWGFGYTFTDIAVNDAFASSSLINVIRFGLATVIFGIVFCKKLKFNKAGLLFGSFGGILLFVGFLLQTMALEYTSVTNNAFFTSTSVLFVPFLLWIFTKRSPRAITWIGITLAMCGLFVLNLGNTLFVPHEVTPCNDWIGDLLSLLAALCFAAHMVLTAYVMKKHNVDRFQMTFLGFAAATLCFIVTFLLFNCDQQSINAIDWKILIAPVLFLAVFNTAFAYTVQLYAQLHVSATRVALILSTEAVCGALVPIILGREDFTLTILIGGLLVVSAVILVQYVSQKHEDERLVLEQTACLSKEQEELSVTED